MLTSNEMNRIQTLLAKASDSDMTMIATLFNQARATKSKVAASSFSVGDRVKWNGKYGANSGVVEKVNRKNIIVKTPQGMKWNVAAVLLNKA